MANIPRREAVVLNRLHGKRALITGSARGIGLGIAERFIREGASVILVDVLQDELTHSASRLQQEADRSIGDAPRVPHWFAT
ncbi:SDR family NAD(P)-dependent oxidoreductase [Paenibacillus sp. GCM10023250]|uniref:SDR family NAD(P)-dependent oxidoreductase n=1 Tax=Paenibacillus sp. GCM10023250 TaxID=3252648 RepID=UPI00361786CB